MVDGLKLSGLTVKYRQGSGRPALIDLDLEIPEGAFAVILGPNGAGKSTLLRALVGLEKPAVGRIQWRGKEPHRMAPKARAQSIAYLAQNEAQDAPYTALELVLMGRFAHQPLWPFDTDRDVSVAKDCLAKVDATDLAERRLDEMSGGERQRVHLARVLAQEAPWLLLDEPAAALDLQHQVETYALLSRLHRQERKTVVLVSHDINLPISCATHVYVLAEGRLAAAGSPTEVLRVSVLQPIYKTPLSSYERSDGLGSVILPTLDRRP